MSYPPLVRRLLAMLAVVGIASGGALALTDVAVADESFSRDGWCRAGEGQTVVIDWRATADALPDVDPPQIIRCIVLATGATTYPLQGRLPLITPPLESAGIPYELDAKNLVSSINGVPTNLPDKFSWNWSTGTIAQDGTDAFWLGKSAWEPEAAVDTFVGITLTDAPSVIGNAVPAALPVFDPAPFTPSPSPTATASPSASASTSASVSVSPSASATASASSSPTTSAPSATMTPPSTPAAPNTAPATQPAPVTTAAPTPTAAPATTAQRPSRTQRPPRSTRPPRRTSRPERPTSRPQPPVNPPAPPISEPPPPPTPQELPSVAPSEGSGQATDVPAAAPSRVWGREDTTRQGSEPTSQRTPAPWSRLVALAGAVVVVGGLGTAFARGLQTSTPPVVEEE